MSRKADRNQFSIIVDFMEKNVDFFKKKLSNDLTRKKMDEMWDELTTTLNANGRCCKSKEKWISVSNYVLIISITYFTFVKY